MTGKGLFLFPFVDNMAIEQSESDFVIKVPASKGTIFSCADEVFWLALTMGLRIEDTNICFSTDG